MNIVNKVLRVNYQYILSKINDYDIYRYYCPVHFTIGKEICSPLRSDRHPSMAIYLGKDMKLHHRDAVYRELSGDCFDFVCQLFGIPIEKALLKVATDFGILDELEGKDEAAYKTITNQYGKPIKDLRRQCLIQCTTKPFTSVGNAYWEKYGIGIEKRKEHSVYQLKDVFINRRKVSIKSDELIFGYYYSIGWKIMFLERSKEEKWKSNIPLDFPEKLNSLDKGKNALIVKSKKCLMCMENIYPYTVGVQNESIGAITEKTAAYIKENSKEVFLCFDSDKPGKAASRKVTATYMFKHVNTPDTILPLIKDLSDWYCYTKGDYAIRKHLLSKNII